VSVLGILLAIKKRIKKNPRRVTFSKAAGIGAKDTLAIVLITIGVDFITKQEYVVGGALVFIGWVLLVVNRYVL